MTGTWHERVGLLGCALALSLAPSACRAASERQDQVAGSETVKCFVTSMTRAGTLGSYQPPDFGDTIVFQLAAEPRLEFESGNHIPTRTPLLRRTRSQWDSHYIAFESRDSDAALGDSVVYLMVGKFGTPGKTHWAALIQRIGRSAPNGSWNLAEVQLECVEQ